jgi:hypothetical protein
VIFVDRESISSRDAATSPEPLQHRLQEEYPFREKLVSDTEVEVVFDMLTRDMEMFMKIFKIQ